MASRTAVLPALMLALVMATGACDDAERDEAGNVRTAGDMSVYQLRTGDCFNGGERVAEATGQERTVNRVTAVPCDQAHDNEVFGVFKHPAAADAAFPGEEAVNQVAQEGCLERFQPYVGRPYDGSDLQVAVIAPGEKSWKEEHDRAIACVLYGDGRLEGSQKEKATG
jgi:hypothetical protein